MVDHVLKGGRAIEPRSSQQRGWFKRIGRGEAEGPGLDLLSARGDPDLRRAVRRFGADSGQFRTMGIHQHRTAGGIQALCRVKTPKRIPQENSRGCGSCDGKAECNCDSLPGGAEKCIAGGFV